MGVEFGFVSTCLSEHDASPAHTVRATEAARLDDDARRLRKRAAGTACG